MPQSKKASPALAQSQAKYTPEQAKALEDWTYAVALDAANWGSPAVIMYNMRASDAVGPKPKAAPNTIWRMENISTPQLSVESGYVTPNVNVIYGFGFLDLGPEPIILSVPDSKGRYYLVEIVDMYSNAFAYAGGTATGYKGGKFALVGPGFKGTLPAGVQRIDCPTRWTLIQPRVHVINPTDLPARPEGHARDHGARPCQVHRQARAGSACLQLCGAQGDRRQAACQRHELHRSAAVLGNLLRRDQ